MKCDELKQVEYPIEWGLYYDKENVDEAIAELKAENKRLRGESCKLTDGCLRLKQCRKEKANIADELRHHKYKRCLAMAKICEDKFGTVVKPGWWNKWHKRWLKLAEKFKEAK